MNRPLSIIVRSFAFLLRLYPRSYREEFAEEMLLDFANLAADASKMGRRPLILFCLRELVEFPINLLRIHWRDRHLARVFQSPPVDYGLRGALGFGVLYPLRAILIGSFILDALGSPVEDSPIWYLEALYLDLFHTWHGTEMISWLPGALHALVTGLFLGIVFALLFADRRKYPRYILVTAVCWLLHSTLYDVLMQSTNLVLFLGTRHDRYLQMLFWVLSGAFLGLVPYVVRSERRGPFRMLMLGALGYPLITYLYLQLLFKLSIIETPWMFIALLVLVIIFLGSVVLMAVKSELTLRIPWLLVFAVIGYFLLSPGVYLLMSWLGAFTGVPTFLDGVPHPLASSVYGMLLGSLLGVLLGLHTKSGILQKIT
jgi:ABC-type amino acid transport system permease subunit